MRDFFIGEEEKGKRLDLFISELPEGISRSYAQKLIEGGFIKVNDRKAKPSYRLKLQDKISIEIPPPQEYSLRPENIPIDIIYEDDDIIVVNKKKGMVVHPAPGNYSGTLVNALLFHCKRLSPIGGVLRPGIVHRLDKDTSGLIVVAKNEKAHLSLSKQIKERKVNKEYVALVHGEIKNSEGVIEARMGRHPVHRKKMAVLSKVFSSSVKSREAITYYRVLERFKDYTLVKLRPITGRTHQIRVHMSYIGHPIVGDLTYGKRKNKFGIKGQMLHAIKLGFFHPSTGKYVEFEAPFSDEIKETVGKLKSEVKI